MTGKRPRSGDGFIECSDGHVRWGVFGAAGAVFVHLDEDAAADPDAEPAVLLQLRSAYSHEGGTWSCPGGALHGGEAALDGALRESEEEIGAVPTPHRLLGEHVFAPAVDWTYTSVVIAVPQRFGAPCNFETEAVEWVAVSEVTSRPLHAGFLAAWADLVPIVLSVTAHG